MSTTSKTTIGIGVERERELYRCTKEQELPRAQHMRVSEVNEYNVYLNLIAND